VLPGLKPDLLMVTEIQPMQSYQNKPGHAWLKN